jgi:hypothetical protein
MDERDSGPCSRYSLVLSGVQSSGAATNVNYFAWSLVPLVSQYRNIKLVSAVGLNTNLTTDVRETVQTMKHMCTPTVFNFT